MNSRKLALCLALLPAISAMRLQADMDIPVTTYEYKIGGETHEGFVARPLQEAASQPGLLVVHDWTGYGAFSREQAVRLARLGYIAFAVDMYGKDVRAKDATEASRLAGRFYQNPPLIRENMLAALEELRRMPGVDPARLGAIGFSFGGTCVLELARSGAELAGVVSFHARLRPFSTQPPKRIVPKILILHGTLDPRSRPDDVAACMNELNAAGVAYRFVGYPLAVHAFTNPAAGSDPSTGTAYQESAAKAAFEEMERFLLYIFQ